jgi:hypothetical protein
LIGQLAGGLQPVRRVLPPPLLALAWLGMAVAVLVPAALLHGSRPDLIERMGVGYDVAQFALAVATGVLSAVAVARLALPDSSPRWMLLPLPTLLGWLLALGFGCLQEYWRMGPAALHLHDSWGCVKFIGGVGLPLAAAQYWVLRHAGPVRPLPIQLLGAVGSASLVAAVMTLLHPLDTAVLILLWHGLAVALVVLLGWAFGRHLMLPVPRR